ncbi:MAG: hypothetical protein JNK58_13730 [Phycisphaerae bacterium]|nr:hypothetical protein [Phycisphaerae bacterium]
MLRFLALTFLLALPARAEVIPLDPAIAFDDLAAHYRRGPHHERIEVRVTRDGTTRAEPILLRIEPPDTLQVTLNDLTVWSDGTVLRLFDRQDEQAYVEHPVERRDLIGALNAAIPPLPLPQIALAFADKPDRALTDYTRGVHWSNASVDDAVRPAITTIKGASDRAEVSLTADASTGRVLGMRTVIDGGRTIIELTSQPLAQAETPPLGIDVARRTRVSDPSSFRPRGSKVLVGDTLPVFGFTVWRNDENLTEEPAGPAAVIFIRHWQPGTSPRAAYEAARALAAERPGFQPFIALIFEVGEPNESAIADGVKQEAEPIEVHRAYDPDRSIVRFSEAARQLLVVIDREQIVRAVEPLTPREPGAPIDPAEVERLKSLMRRAIQ